jgi:hypothetical protein
MIHHNEESIKSFSGNSSNVKISKGDIPAALDEGSSPLD